PDGPVDTHTLAMHPDAPGRLYSAAGDGVWMAGRGYSESLDGGDTWARPDDGIEHHYLFGLAVDPGDPDTVVVSAADSPFTAHDPRIAESTVYRRGGRGRWREVQEGLPEPKGTLRALLATNAEQRGVFYSASNRGVFCSEDGGVSWEPVVAPLPDRYAGQSPNAIAVAPSPPPFSSVRSPRPANLPLWKAGLPAGRTTSRGSFSASVLTTRRLTLSLTGGSTSKT